eukprot:TRINITY_DN7857_c0_g2_i1.p1 TRINITY_DN7857_c0_g2~~TRINITY_DN7857_c0_g2_i1.p1  ORF type:complete len:817 (-),score=85.32 TRINITY_DN7857_c0_g2_i1:49-2499(-)
MSAPKRRRELPLSQPPLCRCPFAWEVPRLRLMAALAHPPNEKAFRQKLPEACTAVRDMLFPHDFWGISGSIKALATGSRARVDAALWHIKRRFANNCLTGFAVGAYACTLVASFDEDISALAAIVNIALPILTHAGMCLPPGNEKWPINAGQAMRNILAIQDAETYRTTLELKPMSLPVCYEDHGKPKESLIGYCGLASPHKIRKGLAGPLDPISLEDVALCTHTTLDKLHFVEASIISWDGAASVSVFCDESHVEDSPDVIQVWLERLAGLGLRQVIVSLVYASATAMNDYDKLYPANVLRQVAVDAATAEFIVLADPAFVPTNGLRGLLTAGSILGDAVRAISGAAPTAFLISAFVVLDDEVAPEMLLSDLVELVNVGSAVSFDAYVCPLCRPHAWQWSLLEDARSLRFHAVDAGDLHHPAWLVRRSLLPRLPGFLHGLVGPVQDTSRVGWIGLPCGLRASAEQMVANHIQLLVLPGAALHRSISTPLPGDSYAPPLLYDIMYRYFLASMNATAAQRSDPVMPHYIFCCGGRIAHIVPRDATHPIMLQKGYDDSIRLVVPASLIMGAPGLQRLLASVPYTVYAVAVGAENFWPVARRQLPILLRTFPRDAVVMVLDAYDTILFPCGRSLVDEYRALGKDIVISAEKTCWPRSNLCLTCKERYDIDSEEFSRCKEFPHVNSGGYMGGASALADAFDWMASKGDEIGRDDQENAWHYYRAFRDRVALDHGQRIWSTMIFCSERSFRVANCSVISDYIKDKVCVAHANGGSRWIILDPLLQQLQRRGCMSRSAPRKADAYLGLSMTLPKVANGPVPP